VTRLVISPLAEGDLEDIWLAIAADNPAAATNVLQSLGKRIDRLAAYPRLGPRRPEIRTNVRVLVEDHYLVLYETHPDTDDRPVDLVEIVRVIDGRRDLKRLF
jgi:toxin ParE1/3/4